MPTSTTIPGSSDETGASAQPIAFGHGVSVAERYQALVSVAESITSCREPGDLFRRLPGQLQRVVSFDFLGLVLHDPERGVTRPQVLETATMVPMPLPEAPIEGNPTGWVMETGQALIIADTAAETRWPELIAPVREAGVASFCLLPLTTARRRLGALALGRRQCVRYAAAEIELLGDVAKLVAVAIENALNFDDVQSTQRQLAAERDRLRLLLDVTEAVVCKLDLSDLIGAVSLALHRVVPIEFASLALHTEPEIADLVIDAAVFKSGRPTGAIEGTRVPMASSPSGRAFTARRTHVFDEQELITGFTDATELLRKRGIRAVCCVPLIVGDDALGTLNVGSLEPGAFTPEVISLVDDAARPLAMAVANAMAFRKIAQLNDKLAEERLYLESEIRTEHRFDDIIGDSAALRHALQQVEVVAPTDATVLLLGETGTGKEVLARAIHDRSARRQRTFVKLNCAAIPSGLLESELFGHEKGAFTGAIAQRVGRFQLADGGTLFLDEVGEIPLELQPKLLRVLQEQEFERVGGAKTIKVDVRIIAATNRDLAQMAEEQRFRDDLYYRLNVFPIHVPALRERPEDIPALVRYFVRRLARPMNRRVEVIPTETLEKLRRYSWPGNVRELANLVERAMILSRGRTLEVPLDDLARRRPRDPVENDSAQLKSVEREHVLRALEKANWVLGGPRGAAVSLGMKRTTLQSLMKRLRIERPA